MAETREERRARIEAEVAARSAARRTAYFEEQAKAKAAAQAAAAPLPQPDAFVYNYAWRQDVGGPGGELALVKTPNPYYDPSTNTIIDPITGERRIATPSMIRGTAGAGGAGTGAGAGSGAGAGAGASAGGSGGGAGANAGAGTTATSFAAQQAAQAAAEEKRRQGQSAFDLLRAQFAQYGLESLVSDVEKYIKDGLSQAEFTLRLRTESDAYKRRFAANAQRIQKGLRALSEGEYIALEDQYQNVMRNYGLPASYYARGDMGIQQGFEKFIAGDVSAAELEDRIQTAQNRVINAAPEVARSLREFYPDITNGDILAYALDPDKALTEIRRKVTAAEIGAGAMQAGLATGVARAEELQRFGVTGEQARAGFQAISDILPRGRQLSEIYGRQGVGPFTQETAEREVFGLTGAAEAGRQRRKLTELEQASFSGQAGAAGGALARDRAGAF